MELRKRGARRAPPPFLRPSAGYDEARQYLNREQMQALETLYNGSPSISAVRQILRGELFRGGLCLKRDGKDVDVQPEFRRHLNGPWMRCAERVLDSFLKWGLCVLAVDEDQQLTRKRRRLPGGGAVAPVLIPIVPELDAYDLKTSMGGRRGYQMAFHVYTRSVLHHAALDENARVFVLQKPDGAGNVRSPMASCSECVSFSDALIELALCAEISNARPSITTQAAPKRADEQNMPFDTEGLDIATDLETQDNRSAVRALDEQLRLTRTINRLQTTRAEPPPPGANRPSVAHGQTGHLPPAVPAQIFMVPLGQQLVHPGPPPAARGDLCALLRLCTESIASAFGVPVDLILNGRYDSKTTAEIQLLHSTVRELAVEIGRVLTDCYEAIYGEADVSVHLCVQPLSPATELLAMHKAGVLPRSMAIERALHSIGASRPQILKAIEDAAAEDAER